MGTDDSPLIEGVEPSSFAAAGDRLFVHRNTSFQATSRSSKVSVEELEELVEDSAFQEKKAEQLEFDLAEFRKLPNLANDFQKECVLRCMSSHRSRDLD